MTNETQGSTVFRLYFSALYYIYISIFHTLSFDIRFDIEHLNHISKL